MVWTRPGQAGLGCDEVGWDELGLAGLPLGRNLSGLSLNLGLCWLGCNTAKSQHHCDPSDILHLPFYGGRGGMDGRGGVYGVGSMSGMGKMGGMRGYG